MGEDKILDPKCQDPQICWSLFVRVGKVNFPVWELHKFYDDILNTCYDMDQDFKESLKSSSQQSLVSIRSSSQSENLFSKVKKKSRQ